jgi:sulfur-carrier protein
MKVKVKLFATLRNGRFNETEMKIDDFLNISGLLILCGLDQKEVAIIFINGKHGDYKSIVNDGDEIAFFPPIGGG